MWGCVCVCVSVNNNKENLWLGTQIIRVDFDGIEIAENCVNLKHFAVWNKLCRLLGDDSRNG